MNRALIAAGDFLRHLQNEGYGLFVQDDWRGTPKLAVYLGLGGGSNTVGEGSRHPVGNLDPSAGLAGAGKQIGAVFYRDPKNTAPRVGFGRGIYRNGKT